MRVCVIGAGITGCATAFELSAQGHEVYLYEMGASIGGSLRDFHCGSDRWFRGCQYVSPNNRWLKNIRSELDCDFFEFEHTYASLNDIDDEVAFRDDIALPVFDCASPMLGGVEWPPATLEDRFRLYGERFGSRLSSAAARCGYSPSTLSADSAIGLQMSAVMFQRSIDCVLSAKSADPIADKLFALPRTFRNGAEKPIAALPVGGYDVLFDSVHRALERRGVEIRLNIGVTPRMDQASGAIVPCRGRSPIPCDFTVWCCNPVPLILAAGIGRLDSPESQFRHIHCEITGGDLASPTYIQFFSLGTSIYRVYLYPSTAGAKACIECYPLPEQPPQTVVSDATEAVKRLLPKAGLDPKHVQTYTAHFLYTPKDRSYINRFEDIALGWKLAPGSWAIFGRNKKIENILYVCENLIPK